MEKQVWRIGKNGRCVVSDVITTRMYYTTQDYETEKEYYGGYIIAESIPDEEITKLITAAPEMLEALQILIGDIDTAPIKLTTKEKLIIARKAIKKATE